MSARRRAIFLLLATACNGTGHATEGTTSAVDTSSTGADNGECDVFAQDCADGEKCLSTQPGHIRTLLDDDVASWCSPVAADAVALGGDCIVDPMGYRASDRPFDNCAADLVCWGVHKDHHGRCERMCANTAAEPTCPSAHFCPAGPGLNGVMCVPECDPLAQDCTGLDDACYLLGGHWGYYPRDLTTAGTNTGACSYPNDCAVGGACVSTDDYPSCNDLNYGGCCTAFCDLADADADAACAGFDPERTCQPWPALGDTPDAMRVGVCLPAA